MTMFNALRSCVIASAMAFAGAAQAQAQAINYLVLAFNATATFGGGAQNLAVTAQTSTACPAGAAQMYYGIEGATPFEGYSISAGAPLIGTGSVCIKGVPSAIKLSVTGVGGADVMLKATDSSAVALTPYNGVYSIGATYLTYSSVAIVFPDQRKLVFNAYSAIVTSGTYAGRGSYGYSVTGAIVEREQNGSASDTLSQAAGYVLYVAASSSINQGWSSCNGRCGQKVPVNYTMGY